MELDCPAFTATPFLHVDGLLISSVTGEIYGYDDKPSLLSEAPDYQPELSKCRSADDLDALLKHVDRRKLPPHTQRRLIDAQDYAHGEWRRTGTPPHGSSTQHPARPGALPVAARACRYAPATALRRFLAGLTGDPTGTTRLDAP